MDLWEAMERRHSVRQYTDRPIEGETREELLREVNRCNEESGLSIQLVLEDPAAFGGLMARYGSFRNVKNYLALVGTPGEDFEERCGYYGERLVLKAAQLGLNTCWVALTYRKSKTSCVVKEGEKLLCVIAIGYGATQGVPHKNKPLEQLCQAAVPWPDWFQKGMAAAQLAPTAMNQQKFCMVLDGTTVTAKALKGHYARLDLGIVKYHFEVGAGPSGWQWAEDER